MITKIAIKLKNKEVSLTVEEAKKLYADLNELFGKPAYYPYPVYVEKWVPQYPPTYWWTTSDDGSTYILSGEGADVGTTVIMSKTQ